MIVPTTECEVTGSEARYWWFTARWLSPTCHRIDPCLGRRQQYSSLVKRVAVVDDDKDICTLVQYRLGAMGMDVDTYFDGESGLAAIVANPPDLAIIDVLMPGMNGLDVTRALRAAEATKDLPIAIFSALVRPADQEVGLEAGADHYVIKPFSVSALGAFVDKILGLRTCTVCGARWVPGDIEFSAQHGKSGWTSTSYGAICGDCHLGAFARLADRIAGGAVGSS